MPRKAPDPADELRALEAATDCAALAAGLASARARVVARAAGLAAERLCYGLEAELSGALRRLIGLADPRKDPGCQAKGALARALVALDCMDAAVYRLGLGVRQLEPVWGGRIDTAADLRASCAMGLAASGDPRALIDLVDLLADPEHRARAGAARAIACTAPLAAEAVLRLKVLAGDAEPEVIGECLRGLLTLAPESALAFVAGLLGTTDEDLAELAALALGESRLDAAVALLRARWEAAPLRGARERVLLRGAVLARSPAAFDWLLGLVAGADARTAAFVVTELAVYRGSATLTERLCGALSARGGEDLASAAFARDWAAPGPDADEILPTG